MSADSTMMDPIGAATLAVQANCDLADAHHAQAMSLCAYLLDMREYCRWQQGLPLGEVLEKSRLAAWISDCERRWDLLRESHDAYVSATGDGDPFDEIAASRKLVSAGLVVGAGVGRFGRPIFCLAELGSRDFREGVEIVIAGRELARGMTAPPAVSRDGRILIRLDAMQRWLWSRFEEWRHHPHGHGYAAAWALYAGVRGEALERLAASMSDAVAVVERMARAEAATLVEHELAEISVGRDIDAEFAGGEVPEDVWEELLEAIGDRRTETFARALRDLAADCGRTLPALLERDAEASIHFWFGNLEGMRRALAPGLHDAYLAWCDGDRRRLELAISAGAVHWRRACGTLFAAWRNGGAAALSAVAADLDGVAQK